MAVAASKYDGDWASCTRLEGEGTGREGAANLGVDWPQGQKSSNYACTSLQAAAPAEGAATGPATAR